MDALSELKRKLGSIWPQLDERARRLTAANEAMSLGHCGITFVLRACRLSRKEILEGIREIDAGEGQEEGRIRRPGGGREVITVSDLELLDGLDGMIERLTRGDPGVPTALDPQEYADDSSPDEEKHAVSRVKVAQILHEQL
jgi:hypothetical protein